MPTRKKPSKVKPGAELPPAPETNVIVADYYPRSWQTIVHKGLETHRFGIVVAHRRAGKTVAMINHTLKQAMANQRRRPRPQYAYLAPTYAQVKRIAWDYFKDFARVIPGTRSLENDLELYLPNGGKIMLLGADRSPERIRGIHLDGVVIDEPADLDPSVWNEIVRPTLSDRRGWAVFIGTVHGFDLFYQLWCAAVEDPEWFTYMAKASETGILPKAELEQARKHMGQSQYEQEYECLWLAQASGSFISAETVKHAQERKYPRHLTLHSPVVFGIDPARRGGDEAVLVIRQGLQVLACIVWRDLNTMELADQIISQISLYSPDAIFCDSVGLGAGVVDRLNQLGHEVIGVNGGAKPMRPEAFFNKRVEMWAKMRDWLQEGGSLIPDSQLADDLISPLYSFSEQGRCVLERKHDIVKRINRSTDRGDALAFTFAYDINHIRLRNDPKTREAVTEYDVLSYNNIS